MASGLGEGEQLLAVGFEAMRLMESDSLGNEGHYERKGTERDRN